MQFGSPANRLRLLSNVRVVTWSFFLAIPLLILAGCGGGAPGMSQTQSPTLQPATPSDPQSSGSGSEGSGTGSSGSGDSGSTQGSGSSGVPSNAKVTSAVQALPDWQWCTAQLDGHECASGL